MKKLLDFVENHWALFFLGASVLILGAAYFFEYVLEYQPCELCLYQRYPFWLIIFLSIPAYLMRQKTDLSTKRSARGLLVVITVLFFLNVFLAAHHIGVEQGYWEAFTSCTGIEVDPNATLEEMLNSLPERSVPCDGRPTFLGISFAEYNFVFSLILGGLGIYTFRKTATV